MAAVLIYWCAPRHACVFCARVLRLRRIVQNTGAATYEMPAELMKYVQTGDLLADVMIDILRHVLNDEEQCSDATMDVLWQSLSSEDAGLYLAPEELAHLKASTAAPADWDAFDLKAFCEGLSGQLLDFCAAQPPSARQWIYMRQVVRGGMIWFNKQTANIQHEPPQAIIDALHRLNHQSGDMSEYTSQVSGIDTQIRALTNQLASVQGSDPGNNRTAAREINELEQELGEAQSQLEQTEHHHGTLQTALDAAKKHENADAVEIAILEDARIKFETELDVARSAHESEKVTLSELVESQRLQIEALAFQLGERQGSLGTAQQSLDTLSQDIKDARKQKRIVTATSAEAESINSLRHKYEQLLADHARVRALNDERNKQIRIVRTQLGETREKNGISNKKAMDMEKMERRLMEITEAHATAKSFLHAKTLLLHSREQELDSVKQHLRELQSRERRRSELLHDALDRKESTSPKRRSSMSRSASGGKLANSLVELPSATGQHTSDTRNHRRRSSSKQHRRSQGTRSNTLPTLAPLPAEMETKRISYRQGGKNSSSRF